MKCKLQTVRKPTFSYHWLVKYRHAQIQPSANYSISSQVR